VVISSSLDSVSNPAETMQTEIVVLVCAVFLGAVRPAQLTPIRVYVGGEVTVSTSDSLTRTTVSVTGRAWRDNKASAEREFVFCIAHPEPIAAKLNYKGCASIEYRATRNRTSRATTAGPEQILPALAVLQSDGKSRFFLADGQSYPHPPNERSVGRVTTFRGVNVTRPDYRDRDGKRRGAGPSACFATER
jgi:hypothetical protein